MIHIHATNLGVKFETTDSTLATAKDFSWSIRLSTEDTSTDKDTTVVEMPQEMALSLFWWYCNKEASNQLEIHLDHLLNHDEMKDKILKSLEYSVALLDKARNNKVFGRVFLDTEAYMAYEIEEQIEYKHESELYALLDEAYFFQV